jgi:hypothetical protein
MKKANKRASKITYLFVCGFVLLSFSLVGPKAQSVSEAAEIMNPLSPDDKVIPQKTRTHYSATGFRRGKRANTF